MLRTASRFVNRSLSKTRMGLQLQGWFNRRAHRRLLPGHWEYYDWQTVEVMYRVMGVDSCAIDVGAHSGAILKEILQVAPRGQHIAVEPLPYLAAGLVRDFPQVKVHNVALGSERRQAVFHHVRNNNYYSGLKPTIRIANADIEKIPVQVERLDDLVPPDRQIAFLKIDTEGAECEVLRGGADLIARCRPTIVMETPTGEDGVSAAEFFGLVTKELGYRLSTMARYLQNQRPLDLKELDALCSHGMEYYFVAYA